MIERGIDERQNLETIQHSLLECHMGDKGRCQLVRPVLSLGTGTDDSA